MSFFNIVVRIVLIIGLGISPAFSNPVVSLPSAPPTPQDPPLNMKIELLVPDTATDADAFLKEVIRNSPGPVSAVSIDVVNDVPAIGPSVDDVSRLLDNEGIPITNVKLSEALARKYSDNLVKIPERILLPSIEPQSVLKSIMASENARRTFIGVARFSLGMIGGTIIYTTAGFGLFQSAASAFPIAFMSGLIGRYNKEFQNTFAYNPIDRITGLKTIRGLLEKYPALKSHVTLVDTPRKAPPWAEKLVWGATELFFNAVNTITLYKTGILTDPALLAIVTILKNTWLTTETQGRLEVHFKNVKEHETHKVLPNQEGPVTQDQVNQSPEKERDALNIIQAKSDLKALAGSAAWFLVIAANALQIIPTETVNSLTATVASIDPFSTKYLAMSANYFLTHIADFIGYSAMAVTWFALKRKFERKAVNETAAKQTKERIQENVNGGKTQCAPTLTRSIPKAS